MQGNALYIDLVDKEIAEKGSAAPDILIKQLVDNPDDVFYLTMTRFKRQPTEWREVIKPVLGVLLVTAEPLLMRHIRQILGIGDDRLKEGIEKLGALVVRDVQQRSSLF